MARGRKNSLGHPVIKPIKLHSQSRSEMGGFSFPQNPYIRSMSKFTRFLAEVAAKVSFTISVVVFSIVGAWRLGETTALGKKRETEVGNGDA